MAGGKWKVGSGRWEVEGGKWKVESGRWKVGGGVGELHRRSGGAVGKILLYT